MAGRAGPRPGGPDSRRLHPGRSGPEACERNHDGASCALTRTPWTTGDAGRNWSPLMCTAGTSSLQRLQEALFGHVSGSARVSSAPVRLWQVAQHSTYREGVPAVEERHDAALVDARFGSHAERQRPARRCRDQDRLLAGSDQSKVSESDQQLKLSTVALGRPSVRA